MKTRRILAVLAATAVLFTGGMQVAGADDDAKVPTVTIDVSTDKHQSAELSQGKPFVVKTVCPAGDKSYQLRLGDKLVASGSAAEGAAGVKVLAAAEQVGKQTLSALCTSYGGTDKTASVDVDIKATMLFIDPVRWKAGDEITVKGFGFAPGESVSLDMVRAADGKSYWMQANVATADANGVFTHKLVLKSDVPLGDYKLIAKGANSNVTLTAEFYWGRPDSDAKKPGDGSAGGAASKGGKKVGLPHTGA